MPSQPDPGAFIHLGNMDLLVNFGGHLRTVSEFDQLFASVGLRRTGVQHLADPERSTWAIIRASCA